MNTYSVVVTLQSPGNKPVEVTWGRNLTPVSAAATVARVVADAEEPQDHMPESVRTRTLSVRIEAEEAA